MRGRGLTIGAIVLVGLVLVASVGYIYVTAYGTGDAHSERNAAMKAARQTQAKTQGRLWVAAYTPNSGSHQDSNTGHACFGRTVEVRMVWKTANFGHGVGGRHTADSPQAAILTADATSGTVCFVSTVYGRAATKLPKGSLYLFGPRRALVPD